MMSVYHNDMSESFVDGKCKHLLLSKQMQLSVCLEAFLFSIFTIPRVEYIVKPQDRTGNIIETFAFYSGHSRHSYSRT